MGQVKVPEILRFPNDDGLLFNHVWGKTLRDGHSNVFGIRRNPQTVICPVKGIEDYMAIARQVKVDLTKRYLFRPTTPQGGVLDASITLSLTGAELSEIMDHVGWAGRHTALYYLQLAKVLNPSGESPKLASTDLTQATAKWENLNELRQFVCAFPATDTASKQLHLEDSDMHA